jgi:DNA-binding GntR family transcriptional regulator
VYAAGAQLKEEQLGEDFGMSRTPIRVALRRLVDEGLLTAREHRGVFVAGWTDWDIMEMYNLRVLLEPYAVGLAAERGTPELPEQLTEINEGMLVDSQSRSESRVARLQQANRAFHLRLLEAAGSHRLKIMVETMIDMPLITRSFELYLDEDFLRSVQQHRDIIYAVEQRDSRLAHDAMSLHLRVSFGQFMARRDRFKQETGASQEDDVSS